MLADYDQAKTHSSEQQVQTHHGVVGEAAVRDWLNGFLPKRYSVAQGYIRGQGLPKPYQTPHFDVIIYDQLEAPILWIEDNKDKSENGLSRIIPVEFVRAVLEVKSTFNRRSVRDAIEKLNQLGPLMSGFDLSGARYPTYLGISTVLAMLFFELREADQNDIEPLNLLRDVDFQRFFYGGVILRGDALHADDTALIHHLHGEKDHSEMLPQGGLVTGMAMTAAKELKGRYVSSMVTWADVNFSIFAFDLIALLNGTYQAGRGSSFHGLEIRNPDALQGMPKNQNARAGASAGISVL
jgi:hypothetical protein